VKQGRAPILMPHAHQRVPDPGPDGIIAAQGVQLNDDNQDDEELEAVGKMTAKRAMSSKERERKKREIITIGKAKGFLTFDEVNDHMVESIGSSDHIDDWLSTLGGEGIEIVDSTSP